VLAVRPKAAIAVSPNEVAAEDRRLERRPQTRSRKSEPNSMNDHRVVAPADEHNDEATQAVQTALDRRDNGGKSGK
jgi:hypothetical protein